MGRSTHSQNYWESTKFPTLHLSDLKLKYSVIVPLPGYQSCFVRRPFPLQGAKLVWAQFYCRGGLPTGCRIDALLPPH